jgi:hypothetical protein
MVKRAVIVGAVLLLGLGSWQPGIQSQIRSSSEMSVICQAPCAGELFGLASGNGVALMDRDGVLWFYPLHRDPRRKPVVASPIKIGAIGTLGGPIEWAPNR